MRSGEPCVGGTRINVHIIGDYVWAGEGVDHIAKLYNLTRGQVLVACWFLGAYGIDQLHGRNGYRTRQTVPWRKRWGAWARQVDGDLWREDYDAVPDPPDKDSHG